jgi:hypothetical protein
MKLFNAYTNQTNHENNTDRFVPRDDDCFVSGNEALASLFPTYVLPDMN